VAVVVPAAYTAPAESISRTVAALVLEPLPPIVSAYKVVPFGLSLAM
jgi:hypothetical protein